MNNFLYCLSLLFITFSQTLYDFFAKSDSSTSFLDFATHLTKMSAPLSKDVGSISDPRSVHCNNINLRIFRTALKTRKRSRRCYQQIVHVVASVACRYSVYRLSYINCPLPLDSRSQPREAIKISAVFRVSHTFISVDIRGDIRQEIYDARGKLRTLSLPMAARRLHGFFKFQELIDVTGSGFSSGTSAVVNSEAPRGNLRAYPVYYGHRTSTV